MLYNGNICSYRSQSLQKLTLFRAVSIFMAICIIEW